MQRRNCSLALTAPKSEKSTFAHHIVAFQSNFFASFVDYVYSLRQSLGDALSSVRQTLVGGRMFNIRLPVGWIYQG